MRLKKLVPTVGVRSGVRLPVLPACVYLLKGSKLVYDVIDLGSEETLISKSLYEELKLCRIPLDVLLITANGSRNLISTFDTSFKVGPADSGVKFDVSQALVMDCLPSIDNNFPTSQNLHPFKNSSDLIRDGKFPRLIVRIRQAGLINYEKIRKPESFGEPFADKCKLAWTIFGPDPYLKSKAMTRCNFS